MYKQGAVSKSFQILNQLAIQNPEKGYYGLLGKLSLSLNANGLAVDYYKNAFQNGRLEIAPELAFAYMEYGAHDKADFIWKQIQQSGDTTNVEMANRMLNVLEVKNIQDIFYKDTELKFSFLKYRYKEFDLGKLEGLAISFDSEDLQALGLIQIINAYLELNQNPKAFSLLQKVGELKISEDHVLKEINLSQCKYAYYTNDEEIMQRLYSNLKSEDKEVDGYLQLFRLLDETKTKGEEYVKLKFEDLGYRNPLFEPGVIESVRFFNQKMNDPDMAYDILLNAVNLNPFSVELNKAYALQCLMVGLKSYAMDAKEELKTMMPSVMFETFEAEFKNKMVYLDTINLVW